MPIPSSAPGLHPTIAEIVQYISDHHGRGCHGTDSAGRLPGRGTIECDVPVPAAAVVTAEDNCDAAPVLTLDEIVPTLQWLRAMQLRSPVPGQPRIARQFIGHLRCR